MSAAPIVSRETLLATVERTSADFAALVREADLAARVPSCPDFDLADLASHLGGVHVWATDALVTTEQPPRPKGVPADAVTVADWYAGTARRLLEALRDTDPGTPCFTFGPPQTAAFWVRRQAHETTLHLWDAQSALGRPAALDPQLSADGIAEVLTVFLPRQVALGRTSAVEHPVALEATDTGSRWLLGEGEPLATVRGPASRLLLLLWQRVPLDDAVLEVDGDPTATLSLALTP